MTIPITVSADAQPGEYQVVTSAVGHANQFIQASVAVSTQLIGAQRTVDWPNHSQLVTVVDQ